jgi:hypothetical protein
MWRNRWAGRVGRRWWWASLVALLLVGGCHRRSGRPQPAPPSTNNDAGAVAGAPVWSRDVGPAVEARCGACHGTAAASALAPPYLGSYPALRQNAGAVQQAMRRRTMPPFGADNSGLCGEWADANWLSRAEIETFDAWVQAGTPAGDSTARPARSSPSDHRDGSSARLDLGAAFAPGLGDRASRCFLVAPSAARLADLLSLAVTAEPAGAIRQATLYVLSTGAATQEARRRAAITSDEPGWSCPGMLALEGARLVASWSRNTPEQRMPPGTGIPLAGTEALVVQLRYDLVASPPGVLVRAFLDVTTGAAARVARFVPVQSATGRPLPAGLARAQVQATWTARKAGQLWGLIPGMNALGRVLDVELLRRSERHCVAHFGHWDRYDEQLFRRTEPLALIPGDVIALTCEYSTASRTTPTKMGEAPDDERCLAQLYVTDEP